MTEIYLQGMVWKDIILILTRYKNYVKPFEKEPLKSYL